MDSKYTKRVSNSTTDGEYENGVWKVVSSSIERRKADDGDWESTGISITVFDVSFEAAQQLAIGFLYDVIVDATSKSEIDNPSLFDLDIPKEVAVNGQTTSTDDN